MAANGPRCSLPPFQLQVEALSCLCLLSRLKNFEIWPHLEIRPCSAAGWLVATLHFDQPRRLSLCRSVPRQDVSAGSMLTHACPVGAHSSFSRKAEEHEPWEALKASGAVVIRLTIVWTRPVDLITQVGEWTRALQTLVHSPTCVLIGHESLCVCVCVCKEGGL